MVCLNKMSWEDEERSDGAEAYGIHVYCRPGRRWRWRTSWKSTSLNFHRPCSVPELVLNAMEGRSARTAGMRVSGRSCGNSQMWQVISRLIASASQDGHAGRRRNAASKT